MRGAGIHRILQPARHGGAEAHFSGMVDIVEAISIACSAAGWCLTQYCSHNCLLGYWPGGGQDEIWGATPDAMVAGVLIPRCGRARKVDGGWRIGGRWPFASGVYGADWFIAAAFTEGGDQPRVAQMHAVPRAEIRDPRHLAHRRPARHRQRRCRHRGLLRAGPPRAAHRRHQGRRRRAGLRGERRGSSTGLPAFAMFSINQSAVAVGLAQASYDAFVAHTRSRVARMSGKSMADYSTAQVKVAEAHTAIETARLLLHHCCDTGMAVAARGETAPMPLKTELRAKATMAGKLAAEAVDLLFHLSGGAGLYDRNPISRAMRDMNCIRGHITQNWDVNASNTAACSWACPPPTPLFERAPFFISLIGWQVGFVDAVRRLEH